MAVTIYSTHYTDDDDFSVWDGQLAGLFQIKEDVPGFGPMYASPSPLYRGGKGYRKYPPLDDYDTARFRPHP
jgi:hypothetical protein